MNTINFRLTGLTCEACVKLVTNRFKKIPGVDEINIDLKSGNTRITSQSNLDLEMLKQGLRDTHYSISQ